MRGLVERAELARKLHELDGGRQIAKVEQIDKAEQRGDKFDPLKRHGKISRLAELGRLPELALVELGERGRI